MVFFQTYWVSLLKLKNMRSEVRECVEVSNYFAEPFFVKLILLPTIIYPFMFLIRVFGADNVVLSILPDLVTLLVVSFFTLNYVPRARSRFVIFILILHAMLTYILTLFHTLDLRFGLITFRQYTLPTLYCIVFIATSERYKRLPFAAVKCSIVSFGSVCLLSMLNFFEAIHIPPSIEALYPYLNYAIDVGDEDVGRVVFGNVSLHRINLFVGGAIGSSAAILFALGLASIFHVKSPGRHVYKFFGLILVLASFLTLSVSIFIPLAVYFLFIFVTRREKWLFIAPIIILFGPIFFGLNLFVGKSPFEYFASTVLSDFVDYLLKINVKEFVFGAGPRFVSAGYEFVPRLFLVDVGIFRVFVEFGFFNFILFIVFLFCIFRICIRNFNQFFSSGHIAFPFFFLVYLALVHANMSMLPPFFPLFAAVAAGILTFRAEGKETSASR